METCRHHPLAMPSPVPVVDLAVAPARDLVQALVERSCVLVVNHGVPNDVRSRLVNASQEFFALPYDEKAQVQWPGDGIWYGWQPVYAGLAELTGTRAPNPLERFEVNLARPTVSDASVTEWASGFDLWPERPDGFVAAWAEYYRDLHGFANRIVTMIVDELALPPELLDAWTDEHFANLVVNHYLAQPEPPPDGQIRVGVHADQGGLTILWADGAPGGLEVRELDGETWTPVQIPPDAFLLQVGDLLERWTNGHIRANVHRVVNPPRDRGADARRFAVAYFHHPRLDLEVEPAPSCIAPGEVIDDGPLLAGGHILHRELQYRDHADLLR